MPKKICLFLVVSLISLALICTSRAEEPNSDALSWSDVSYMSYFQAKRISAVNADLDKFEKGQETYGNRFVEAKNEETVPYQAEESYPVTTMDDSSEEYVPSENLSEEYPIGKSFNKNLALSELAKPCSFKMDFGASYYRYEEPGVMYIKGGMYEASGEFIARTPVKTYEKGLPATYVMHVQGSYDFPMKDLRYEALNQAGNESDTNDYFYDARGLFGREMYYKDDIAFEVYSGFGYRYLHDKQLEPYNLVYDFDSGRVIRYFSYIREQSYLYLPIGLNFNIRDKKDYQVSFNLEYDWLLKGINHSHTGDVNQFVNPAIAPNEDANFTQRHGYGLRTSLNLAANITPNLEIFAEPFFRYWSIEGSELETVWLLGEQSTMWEPPNKTFQFGGKMGLRF